MNANEALNHTTYRELTSTEKVVRSEKALENGPRIPAALLEVPRQRLYVIALWVALQGAKAYRSTALYTALGATSFDWTFCVQWILIDTAFLFFLRYLRIPWLTFSKWALLVQACILSLLDAGLAARLNISYGSIVTFVVKAFYDREMSLLERSVNVRGLVENTSHITGRHTVNFLPDGMATLNPNGDAYCIDPNSPSAVIVPLTFRGVKPLVVEYTRVDLETNEVEVADLSSKRGRLRYTQGKRDEDRTLYLVELHILRPGLYTVVRAIDESNLEVRLTNAEIVVVTCPYATFDSSPSESLKAPDHICKGSTFRMSITARGVPPLAIDYIEVVGGVEVQHRLENIVPESPPADERRLASLRCQVDISKTCDRVGLWSLGLQSVTDYLGNVVHYSVEDDLEDRNPSRSLIRRFSVYERVQLQFNKCFYEQPVQLAEGDFVDIPIELVGGNSKSFVHVEYTHTPTLGRMDVPGVAEVVTIGRDKSFIRISEAGTYHIESAFDDYCNASILEPSTVVVMVPPPPKITANFSSVEDDCAGKIGINVDLAFFGTAPFSLSYEVMKDGASLEHQQLLIERTQHHLRFTPSAAGQYSYRFSALGDALYAEQPIGPSGLVMDQTIEPLASATFIGSFQTNKCCINDSIDLLVDVTGRGPWLLKYDVVMLDSRLAFTDSISHSPYTLRTPNFKSGGIYTVTLTSIQDGKGCKQTLHTVDTHVDVRYLRPTARFLEICGKKELEVLQNHTANLPVALTGDAVYTSVDKKLTLALDSQLLCVSIGLYKGRLYSGIK